MKRKFKPYEGIPFRSALRPGRGQDIGMYKARLGLNKCANPSKYGDLSSGSFLRGF